LGSSLFRTCDRLGTIDPGRHFHNNNDLDAGFTLLTDGREYAYVLESSINDVTPDQATENHRLTREPSTVIRRVVRQLARRAFQRELG